MNIKTKTKTVLIDGMEVALRCSGATPIYYRSHFHGDLLVEFNRLIAGQGTDEDGVNAEDLPDGAIELLIKAGYIMARQADPTEKRTFEEWADQFSLMGLMNDIGVIADMLIEDRHTEDEPKKNTDQPSAD